MGESKTERAIVFVDANNWYHGAERQGIHGLSTLDWRKVTSKLLMTRTWVELRWYVGRVQQEGSKKSRELYAEQRRFVDALKKQDARISVHFGRIEKRQDKNEAAIELPRVSRN